MRRSEPEMRTSFAFVVVLALIAAACSAKPSAGPGVTTPPGPPPPSSVVREMLGKAPPPLVLTYFFYWYDASTGQHLRKSDGLPIHLPAKPPPSWKSIVWFERQLIDMSDARVNVALPDFWGTSAAQAWSTKGLPRLVEARDKLVSEHRKNVPKIGMFYDTSILNGLDLTTSSGIATFYSNIAAFFHLIPKRDWALVDGRPIIWLFLPQNNKFDQTVFDDTYAQFQTDFGVRPYIVRATGWNCATTKPKCGEPIHTDASFVWGTAQDGVQITQYVASAGPGYDDRLVPGRKGTYVSRKGGAYYKKNLTAAVRSGRPLVAIETWNEIHEASAIAQTAEYGRQYIQITQSIVDAARNAKS